MADSDSLKMSGGSQGQGQRQWTPREVKALRTLLVFASAMILLPISGYFVVKMFLEGVIGWKDGSISGAIGSVIIIHILIAIYVYLAYIEDRRDKAE